MKRTAQHRLAVLHRSVGSGSVPARAASAGRVSTADAAASATAIPPAATHQDNEFIQTALKAGVYGFHLGQPGPELIPLQRIKQAVNEVITESADPLLLQYRQPVDFSSVRENLATMLAEQHGIPVDADCLAITPGNSAALGMIFSNVGMRRARAPGDNSPATAVVENPTYFLAGQMFADVGVETIGVGMDRDGLKVDEITAMCAAGSAPDFVYTVPNFHNPTGISMSAARRTQLLALAEQHDFLVVSDEPYNLLAFGDTPAGLPMIASQTGTIDRVICLGSFSKLLAPGLRLGWIHTSPRLIAKAWRNVGVLDSGGALNPLGSLIINRLLENGFLMENIQNLKTVFGRRIDAMCAALEEHLPGCSYQRPSGGYFMWVELPEDFPADAEQLLAKASDENAPTPVVFTLGNRCIATLEDGDRQFGRMFRMSFAFHTEEEIANGLAALGRVAAGF